MSITTAASQFRYPLRWRSSEEISSPPQGVRRGSRSRKSQGRRPGKGPDGSSFGLGRDRRCSRSRVRGQASRWVSGAGAPRSGGGPPPENCNTQVGLRSVDCFSRLTGWRLRNRELSFVRDLTERTLLRAPLYRRALGVDRNLSPDLRARCGNWPSERGDDCWCDRCLFATGVDHAWRARGGAPHSDNRKDG